MLNTYSHIFEHTIKRKEVFNKQVINSPDSVLECKKGDLIQVCNPSVNFTLSTDPKLLSRGGQPHHIVNCICKSYHLGTTHGLPVWETVSVVFVCSVLS
jgi:hypothetical protein